MDQGTVRPLDDFETEDLSGKVSDPENSTIETEEGRKAVGGSTVIGRVGRPEDIGASCIYLSSRAGSYVNGAVLPVDGGGLVGRYANM